MPTEELIYAIVVLLVAYFVRGISGFGSGLIAVPLLALKFPLTHVVPFMLITDFSASALLGGLNFKSVDRAEIMRLLPASIVGVVVGTSLLVSLPAAALLGTLACFIFIFGIRFLRKSHHSFKPASINWAIPAALTGGAIGGLFGTGGPPYVVYLGHRIEDKSVLRATLSGLFFLEGLIRIVTFLLAGLLLSAALWLQVLMALPLILAALYLGSHIHTQLSNQHMQRLIGALLVISAAALLFKAMQ